MKSFEYCLFRITMEKAIFRKMKRGLMQKDDMNPAICLCLDYDNSRDTFTVELKYCRNLMTQEELESLQKANPAQTATGPGNESGTALTKKEPKQLNVLVKLKLIPDLEVAAKWTSSIQKDPSSPNWTSGKVGGSGKGELFETRVPKTVLELQNLRITVWDVRFPALPGPLSGKKLLGEKIIPLSFEIFQNPEPRWEILSPPRNLRALSSVHNYLGEIEVALKLEYA